MAKANRRGSNIVCMENVDRYYGANKKLRLKYKLIAKSGKCLFCAPNIENEFVGSTRYWNIVHNQFPYKNARRHLLLLPKRHVTSASELSPIEWADLEYAIALAKKRYPSLSKGYGLCLRVGVVGGVTLYHLHFHLIAPKISKKGQIPVTFGIG